MRPRLGLRAWALLVPAVVLLFAVLVGILLVLVSTRSELGRQRELTQVLLHRADPALDRAPGTLEAAAPVLRDAAPVLAATRKALPKTRRAARDTQALLDAARPLVADLGPAAADLGPLFDALQRSDLPSLVTAARSLLSGGDGLVAQLGPLARQVRATDLVGVLSGVQRLTEARGPLLGTLHELQDRELLRRLSRTLPKIGELDVLQQAALGVIRQTNAKTTSIEDMFRESLAIQRELLVHTRSLDRKLGGEPAPGG